MYLSVSIYLSIGILTSRSDRSGRSDVSSTSTSNASNRPKDYASLLKAFEISQHQNEVLSKQLHRMQQSVSAREGIETRLCSIISDLQASIDEVVEVTTTTSDDGSDRGSSSDSNNRCGSNKHARVVSIDISKGTSDIMGYLSNYLSNNSIYISIYLKANLIYIEV
jgi:hypothetical protein